MTFILRNRSGITNLPNLTTVGFIPHNAYSHLVLLDYLSARLPDPIIASPNDRVRVRMVNNFRAALNNEFRPNQPDLTGVNYRLAFTTSYWSPPAHWDRSPAGARTYLTGAGFMALPNAAAMLYGRKSIEAVFNPAAKVLLYSPIAWYFGRGPEEQWFGATQGRARAPYAFYDGSVQVLSASQFNRGRNPNTGAVFSPGELQFQGRPEWGEPVGFLLEGVHRMTATVGGLSGIDYGGGEVRWTPGAY
ncbi:hypothetical protein J4558_21440 [Leptolyngbya sp. 15MV]|nr:hypothetical protein J4558_21440 [Leptolyngbya sp. 15MV]